MQALVLAVALDFVLPIVFAILGFQFAIFTIIFLIFTLGLGIFVVPIIGAILSLIALAIIVTIVLLLGRQIGIFVGLAVLSELIVMGLTSIPEIGVIFVPLALVPWYLLAVITHMLVYKGLCKGGK